MARTRTPGGRPDRPPTPDLDPDSKVPRYFSAAAREMPWPPGVPILGADDLAPPYTPCGPARRPLWGWLNAVFPCDPDPDSPRYRMHMLVTNELFRVQTEELGLPRLLSLLEFTLGHRPDGARRR